MAATKSRRPTAAASSRPIKAAAIVAGGLLGVFVALKSFGKSGAGGNLLPSFDEPEPTSTPQAPVSTVLLRQGDKSEKVRTLQQALIKLGGQSEAAILNSGGADGDYGDGTVRALTAQGFKNPTQITQEGYVAVLQKASAAIKTTSATTANPNNELFNPTWARPVSPLITNFVSAAPPKPAPVAPQALSVSSGMSVAFAQPTPFPKPAPKPVAKAAPKPAPRPVVKAAPKPAPRPVVKVAPKPTPRPVVKAAPKPAPRPVAAVKKVVVPMIKTVAATKTSPAKKVVVPVVKTPVVKKPVVAAKKPVAVAKKLVAVAKKILPAPKKAAAPVKMKVTAQVKNVAATKTSPAKKVVVPVLKRA